jgi:hypothetical protein
MTYDILVRLFELLKPETSLVNDWFEAQALDRSVHFFELHFTPDGDALQIGKSLSRVPDGCVRVVVNTTQKANQMDVSAWLDGFQALGDAAGPAHLDNTIKARGIRGQFPGNKAPFWFGLVVHNVSGPKLFQNIRFLRGGCGGNDNRTSSHGELFGPVRQQRPISSMNGIHPPARRTSSRRLCLGQERHHPA